MFIVSMQDMKTRTSHAQILTMREHYEEFIEDFHRTLQMINEDVILSEVENGLIQI